MSESIISKTCTKCGTEKPISEFHRCTRNKDGLASECKACHAAVNASYRAANTDKIRASNSAYIEANRDKRRAYRTAYRSENTSKIRTANAAYRAANTEKARVTRSTYRAANTGKIRAAVAEWAAANRDKHREAISAWAKANPEKCRIYKQNRRARKIEAGGKLSTGLAVKLFKLQKGKCPCCNQPIGENYHLDHIHPLAMGGENTDGNIQLLRSTCNHQKSAKHPVEFMQERGFLL
jgi:hypothetical protein